MKTRNLLLALGCAAAFTACTNNDEPAVAPAMRTVTLSVEVAEPADTRVAYTEDGTTYKVAWAEGDKLRMFYKNGTEEKQSIFEIKSFSGKQAEFQGDLPADFNGTVNVAYSSTWNVNVSNDGSSDIDVTDYGYTSLEEELKGHTYLYAENVTITNGQLPNVKLNHAVAYLILKEGLQVTDADITIQEKRKAALDFYAPFWGYAACSSSEVMVKFNGWTVGPYVYVKDGKLTHNILVPLLIKEETEVTPTIDFTMKDSSGSWQHGSKVEQSAFKKKFKPGVIYEMKTTDNWVISSFK